MPKIEDHTRERIAEFLPAAISKALESYARFSDQDAPDEAKDFTAHHNACKVAISHIDLLIKMARWADIPLNEFAGEVDITAILATAQAELDAHKPKS